MFRLVASFTVLSLSSLVWAGSPVYTGWFSNTAIKGYDTVAYFTEGKAVKGSSEFSASWAGVDWHFASAEHQTLFEADPERYAPQYGGYCAYAVGAKDELVKVDPEAWSIVDGKLYLNYSLSVRDLWDAKQAEYIRQGDLNWRKHSQP